MECECKSESESESKLMYLAAASSIKAALPKSRTGHRCHVQPRFHRLEAGVPQAGVLAMSLSLYRYQLHGIEQILLSCNHT